MKAKFPIITSKTQMLPFYLTGIGVQVNQEKILREEGYYNFQICYCTEGEGVFKFGDKKYSIKKGHGFYFCPKLPHEYYSIKEPWCIKWITFDGEKVKDLFDILNLSVAGVFKSELHIIEFIYNELYLYSSKEVECSADLYKLMIIVSKLIQGYDNAQIKSSYNKLQLAIEFMNKNYNEQISLENIANHINVSQYYLCRLFKENLNSTPFKCLIQIRIQNAKQLLIENKDLSVKNVSLLCGFNDTSYFNSVFKQQEKITPCEFRKMHGQ